MNRDKFIAFLRESGAEILEPTNPFEMVRFRTINGVSVVYNGKRGIKFTGESLEAYEQHQKTNVWKIRRRSDKEFEKIHNALLERDGAECFFCGKETTEQDRSVEHLLSLAHGGNNNLANLVFAHRACNKRAGSMSVKDKVNFRDSLRDYP